MNKLQIFKYLDLGEIREITINNEPWFVAIDVCNILEIKNSTQAIGRLDKDEVTMLNIGSKSGNTYIINEYGLYALILGSRKKEAKDFKRWITHEVIPAIRKTGGYIKDEETMTDDQLIAKAFTVINKKLELAQQKLKKQEHKVFFADSVANSNDTILIRDLAKILNQNNISIGQNRLYQWLRDNGYLIKSNFQDRNSPTQKAMDLKLFEVKESTINTPYGTKINKVTKVTGKGQVYFVNKFKKAIDINNIMKKELICPFD